jgi:hypothetical protein
LLYQQVVCLEGIFDNMNVFLVHDCWVFKV